MENNEKTSVSGSKWCVRVKREVMGKMWEFDGGYNPVVKKKVWHIEYKYFYYKKIAWI